MKKIVIILMALALIIPFGSSLNIVSAYNSKITNNEESSLTNTIESIDNNLGEPNQESSTQVESVAEETNSNNNVTIFGDSAAIYVENNNIDEEYVCSLLKQDNIKEVSLHNISYIPQKVIQTLNETGKVVGAKYNTCTDRLSSWWILAPENSNTIKENLDLTFSESSKYADELKNLTNDNNLVFFSFNANENIGKQQTVISDSEYALGASINYGEEKNPLFGYALNQVYVYSYNSKTKEIKKTGICDLNAEYDLSIAIILEKDANNIFLSTKSDLETPKEEVTKTIDIDKIEVKQLEDLISDDEVDKIIVNLSQSDILSSDLINKIKNSNKKVIFNIKDNNNRIRYSWTFDGSNIQEEYNEDINLNIDFKSIHEETIENYFSDVGKVYLQFNHHGKLPSLTTMKVDVSDKYKDGDKVFLYYYNEVGSKIEKASAGLTVKDGYVEFVINHCSTYFLTDKNVDDIDLIGVNNSSNAVQTGDESQILIYTITCALALLTIIGFVIKKCKS